MSPVKTFVYTAVMVAVAATLIEAFAFGLLNFEAWRRPHKFR